MIEQVTLQAYRGHTKTIIPLSPLTLLVGENAVGKSSVLDAIPLVQQLLINDGVPRTLTTVIRKQLSVDATQIVVDGANGDSVWRIFAEGHIDAITIKETSGFTIKRTNLDSNGVLRTGVVVPESTPLYGCKTLRLSPSLLRQVSSTDQTSPGIEPDGRGLASALRHLLNIDRVRFQHLVDEAKSVVPRLADMRINTTLTQRIQHRTHIVDGQSVTVPVGESVVADLLELKFVDSDWLPASAASDGTLIVIALLYELYGPRAPTCLLLDDLDQGLHPHAQGELLHAIKRVQAARPELQVIATSHSPYLVDHFERKSVVVLSRDKDNIIAARRLSDHPDAARLNSFTTGEFLVASGDGWFWR